MQSCCRPTSVWIRSTCTWFCHSIFCCFDCCNRPRSSRYPHEGPCPRSVSVERSETCFGCCEAITTYWCSIRLRELCKGHCFRSNRKGCRASCSTSCCRGRIHKHHGYVQRVLTYCVGEDTESQYDSPVEVSEPQRRYIGLPDVGKSTEPQGVTPSPPQVLIQETNHAYTSQSIITKDFAVEEAAKPIAKMPGMVSANQPLGSLNGSLQIDKGGTTNGYTHHNRSSSSHFGAMRKSHRSSGRFFTSSVEDTTVNLQRHLARELGSSFSERVAGSDYNALVEWIHYERLMSLPKEGSAWDKVSRSLRHAFLRLTKRGSYHGSSSSRANQHV